MKKYFILILIAFSLCACSTGAGGTVSPTSKEPLSPSSTAIPESSEVSSSRGIAPDYKNSPNFLPVGSMEFTVIDNTAVPEFEGKSVEVNEDYFTSLEDKLTKEKMSKLKNEQEIQGLEISPDGKNLAYFLITYIPDEKTGEVTFIDEYSEPFVVKSVQLIVEYNGKTKEFWRVDNYLMAHPLYSGLTWFENEYIGWSTETIAIYNVSTGDSFKITKPEFMKDRIELDGVSPYGGIQGSYEYESKNGIVPFLGKLYEDTEAESYSHYYLCFYNLKEKQWLENYIHFTEFEYSEFFHITWSKQTDDLLLLLEDNNNKGYTFYMWKYNPFTNQRVEVKALKSSSDQMRIAAFSGDMIIWGSYTRRPDRTFLYDYINDQWICYVNGYGDYHKNNDSLYIVEEVIDDSPQYIGDDIYVYDLKNKIKYYYLTSRTDYDE